MYARLALRNIRRSLRDYIIYFVTTTLVAALMYSFLALGFSPDVISMSENMSMLTSGILILSVLIAFVTSFVIGYAIRFMLEQRKKEFATYELMGMEVKTVCRLFLAESTAIGGCAFLLGSLVGTGLSSLLNQLVRNIFGFPHSYQVVFSSQAWAITLLSFALMYGVGMLRAVKVIRRRKVVDLLYDSHRNEGYSFRSIRWHILRVLISIAAMAVGAALLAELVHIQSNRAWLYLGGACLLILAGVYELHRQVPFLLYQFAKRDPYRKYRGENLFLLGQIGRRIQSTGRTMATVAILLTVSLATLFVGLTMGAGYRANMEAYYPYDVGVAIDAPLSRDSMEPVISFVRDRCAVEDSVVFYLYSVPDASVEALSLSDYNHLRQILGLPLVSMDDDEFLIHCDTWRSMKEIQKALEREPEITLTSQTLYAAQTPIMTEPMEQYQMAGTKGFVLVVPDKVAKQLLASKIRLAIKLENDGYPKLKGELQGFLKSDEWRPEVQTGYELPERVTFGVTVKAWGIANSLTGFTTISFCGLYLSIIFIILSCTVLAFEQLSAIDKNQKNYRVIDRLGVSSQRRVALIRKELSTVFFIPLLLPILLTVMLVFGAQIFFREAILQEGLVLLYGLMSIVVFCSIYFTYFGATLFLFKRGILRQGTG